MGTISFASLANVIRIPDIRRKVLFTFFILFLYRAGAYLTVPGIPADKVQALIDQQGGAFALLNLFTGGGLGKAALFGLGIMPYITASIIVQLMTVVVPSLERLQKEGEMGYIKINRFTRYLTVVLATMQSIGFFLLIKTDKSILPADFTLLSAPGLARMGIVVLSMTAGCILLMWMGELITQRGMGNGISLLIFASILAGGVNGVKAWLDMPPTFRLLLPIIALGMTALVVTLQEGQRRIPVQYAKRMVGRRMTQGGSTYLPLKVNMAGVIPIIFATALMAFPSTLASTAPNFPASVWIQQHLSPTSRTGLAVEALLVMFFTYFYTLVQFNPKDQADNLKKYGGFIPGVRPGAPTELYLGRVLTRLTIPGSFFLAFLVVVPTLLTSQGFSQNVYGALGGTTILIVVGVALDAMRQMESQLVMRNYQGFLK